MQRLSDGFLSRFRAERNRAMIPRRKKTALIVDSSPTILCYHGILMKRMRYSVFSAQTPEDARRIMKRAVPDLVLTGITFARESGIDFIRKIKSDPHTSSVPVIVLTSVEDVGTRAACLEAGCAACLGKPVEPECLFWTIQDVSEAKPRQFVRIKTAIRAILGDGAAGGPAEKHGYATTLSEGGLYLRTLSPRSKGELLPVSLVVNGRKINAKAVVLYSVALGAGEFREPGMGLAFVDISEDDRDVLRGFIREQLIADIKVNHIEAKAA
jgi:CheY-like chemotaxis protein